MFRHSKNRHTALRLPGMRFFRMAATISFAIGLEVEVGGHLGEPLVADALDVFLHEAVTLWGSSGPSHNAANRAGSRSTTRSHRRVSSATVVYIGPWL